MLIKVFSMTKRMLKYIASVGIVLLLTISGVSAHYESEDSHCSVPTKIILVRHGQTSWNALGILQGNADVPLDATGVAEAGNLANSTYNKTVNAVYSSPLSRAYDTAQTIASLHNLHVEKERDLREIGVGIYTGYQASQVPLDIRISWSTNPDFRMPSGIPIRPTC